MPDTRYPHQTRDAAQEAVSQTEETGRRIVDAGTENTRRTAEAGAESVRSAVKTGAETTQRAIKTGADDVNRVAETGRDVLHQAADTTRDLTRQWSAMVSFDTPEAENAVRRANAALQAANRPATWSLRSLRKPSPPGPTMPSASRNAGSRPCAI